MPSGSTPASTRARMTAAVTCATWGTPRSKASTTWSAGRGALGQRRIVDRLGQRGRRGGGQIGQRLAARRAELARRNAVGKLQLHARIASVTQDGHRVRLAKMGRLGKTSRKPHLHYPADSGSGQEVELLRSQLNDCEGLEIE